MDYRTIAKSILLLAVVSLGAAACNNENAVPKHTASEEQTIKKIKAMTPEERIKRIQDSPVMPQAAKDSMIKEIKAKNGIK